MKQLLIGCAALLMLSGAVFAESAAAAPDAPKSLSVRTFTFHYKDAEKAAALIKSMMSDEGTISIQPATNALVVTDRAENLRTIAKALAQFDTPPQAFKITVRLIGASHVAVAPKVPDDLRDVAPKLEMFRFNSFENLGSADVAGREGDPGIVTLPTGYRADFKFGEYDPASDSIKVSDFRLSKLQEDQLTPLLKTTLNLRVGETYIFGATKNPQSARALMIVLVARK